MDRLSAIESFIRVVDTGSFSATARHHDIGQPAVSKAIEQLEEWIGGASFSCIRRTHANRGRHPLLPARQARD
jgi:hypothetical protein